MIVTTMNDIPGYAVDEVFGEVMGLTVRSRNIGSQLGAGLKSILGGELKGMTKALVDSRNQVRERMVEEAEKLGANAIIAMRFDTSEMGSNWTEICAYGTAVKVRKADAVCGSPPSEQRLLPAKAHASWARTASEHRLLAARSWGRRPTVVASNAVAPLVAEPPCERRSQRCWRGRGS